jgi:chloride channel protein, CIC family
MLRKRQLMRLLIRFMKWRPRYLTENNFIILLASIIGILAGFVALILKVSVYYLRELSFDNIISGDRINLLFLLFFPVFGIGLTLFFKKYVIRDFVAHTISSLLSAISAKNAYLPPHKMFSSMIGSIFTAGFGGSVGVEAPVISSGAAIGSNLGRLLQFNHKTTNLFLACGSSGAIAAIFNTPIAGIVFALEVLLLDLSRFSLIPLLISSASGTIITTMFYPDTILFDFEVEEPFSARYLPFYMVFGLICGLVAYYFTTTYLRVENWINRFKTTKKKFVAGSICFGLLLLCFPALWGEGFVTIKHLLKGNTTQILETGFYAPYADNLFVLAAVLLGLACLKVVSTALTVGAGGVGGIFAPSLFTGAILGYLFAMVLNALFPGLGLTYSTFVLIGMAGLLSGTLHAPLTGLFLIAEVTFGYELIIPLLITTTISFIASKHLGKNNIITSQVAEKGELITHDKDKAVLTMMSISDLVENDFSQISPEACLGDLVVVVSKSKRNIFPVVDKSGFLEGIILLDDIREIMFKQELYQVKKVKDLMAPPLSYIKIDDKMEEVMQKFNQSNAWNLPVIEKGVYSGFISKSKMFNVYRAQLVEITAE